MRRRSALALALLLAAAGPAAEPNQPPTVDPPPPRVLNEDTGLVQVTLTGVGPGAGGDGQRITIRAHVSDPGLLLDPVVSDPLPGQGNVSMLVGALPDAFGTGEVVVELQDDGGTADGGSDTTTVILSLAIRPLNDPPALSCPDALTVAQGAELAIPVTGISPGPANEIGRGHLALQATAVDPGVLEIVGIDYQDGDAAGTVRVRPLVATAATGSVVVTVVDRAEDGYFVSVLDRVQATSRVVAVAVTDLPDPPQVEAVGAIALGAGGAWRLTPADLAAGDPDGGPVRWRIDALPAECRLQRGATPLDAGGVFTQDEVEAGRIILVHAGATHGLSTSLVLACGDSGGGAFLADPVALPVRIDDPLLPQPYARPMVALLAEDPRWTEGGAAVAIAPGALVLDGDSPSLAGGSLRAAISAGAAAGDRLGLQADGVSVAGGQALVEGVAVGVVAGGTGGQPLVVAFTAAATPAAAQALVRALRFANQGGDPGSATRRVSVVVADGSAGDSPADAASLAVIPVDDPPVIATAAIASPAGVAREVVLAAEDPDDAVLAWSVVAPPAGAALAVVDAAAGRFLLVPGADAAGADAFTVAVATPGATATATIALRLSGAEDPRPQAAAEAPCEAYAGETWSADLRFARDGLAGPPPLDFAADAEAPPGLVLTRLGDDAVHADWAVPDDAPPGVHRRFRIVAAARDGQAAGSLPVSVLVRPRPLGSD